MDTNIANLIIILVTLAIVGAIIFYLYREKKRGATCVGCPYAKQCGGGSVAHAAGGCTGDAESGCGCGVSAEEILAQIKASGEKA